MASCNKPYMFGCDNELTLEEVYNILCKTECDESRLISLPPILPRGGEVFLYCPPDTKPDHEHDFRFDQYRWISKGSNFHSKRKYLPKVLKRYYYLKDPNGKKKDSLPGFRKHVYCLRECKNSRKLYVLHYLGDESLHHAVCHGNSKLSNKTFVGTMKSAITEIKESVQQREPMNTYKHLLSQYSYHGSNKHMSVDRPRNLKQVQNFSYLGKKKKRVCNDELFSLLELAVHLDDYIKKVTIFPDLVVSFGHPEMLAEARKLVYISNQDASLPQLLSYDTTFNVGDFYLSTFVMRNITLTSNPIFPVAFLLHERKFKACHTDFLCDLLHSLEGNRIKSIPIVTDRERGIVEPLQTYFPNIPHIYCTNHILRDIDTWIRKHGGKKDDLKVLKDDITQLIDSKSLAAFDSLYSLFSLKWSKEFRDYFEKNLKECISKNSANFLTSKYAAFVHDKNATNNISESFNKVIKNQNEWKELPVDVLVLSMFYMQCYYLHEFKRASCGLGNYELKEQFSQLRERVADVTFPAFYPLDSIIDKIKSSDPEPVKGLEKGKYYRMSQRSLAKYCIESGSITLCPQSSTFVVRSIYGRRVHAVKLLPEPAVCSCPSTGLCYHIIAAQMAVGWKEAVDKQTYSLSTLCKKKRGRSNRSGRKKPRKGDYDYDVEPAPDSVLFSSPEKGQLIKKRFGVQLSPSIENPEFDLSDLNCQNHPRQSTPKREITKGHEMDALNELPPWDVPGTDLDNRLLDTVENNILKTLDPGEWLCDEVLEEAISNFICQRNLTEKVLLCPTFIYQSMVRGEADIFYSFLENNVALNKDILLLPFNTDSWGPGQHWCLSVIIFCTKEVIFLDSMKEKGRTKEHADIILSIAAACHQVANTCFTKEEWTVYLCEDSVQQNNSFDCGVYSVLNAYSVISGDQYQNVESQLVRKWIALNVAQHKKCNCKRQKRKKIKKFNKGSYSKKHKSLLYINMNATVIEKPLANYISTLVDKDSSRWSTCAQTTCPGTFTHTECMVFCCKCRQWYHASCLSQKASKFPTYYLCQQCSG